MNYYVRIKNIRNGAVNDIYEWFQDVQAYCQLVTISSVGPTPTSDAYVTIGDLIVATEFILVFGGSALSKDEYDAELAVRTIGNFISR